MHVKISFSRIVSKPRKNTFELVGTVLKGGQIRDTKNPQLVAQHSFVASFGRCFAFFTLHDQLDPQQKHLLRVEEMHRADWLICLYTSTFVARQVVSLMKNEQQSQKTFFNPQQMFLLRDKMIMQGEKRETSTQTSNETMLTRQVEGFCISYLAALRALRSSFNKCRCISDRTGNLAVLVFLERGKSEYPEKNLSQQGENQQQTQRTCVAKTGNRARTTLKILWEASV